ncbi:hypothetical protein LZ30DRAFT_693211 [Colletotrichum cereale]|nr:hypothetical protein LZ30DRAFT_693211 [Colletotrichum cereale]
MDRLEQSVAAKRNLPSTGMTAPFVASPRSEVDAGSYTRVCERRGEDWLVRLGGYASVFEGAFSWFILGIETNDVERAISRSSRWSSSARIVLGSERDDMCCHRAPRPRPGPGRPLAKGNKISLGHLALARPKSLYMVFEPGPAFVLQRPLSTDSDPDPDPPFPSSALETARCPTLSSAKRIEKL